MDDYSKIVELYTQCRKTKTDWRKGQALFNAILMVRCDLADEIRSNPKLDPYYNDERARDCITWLAVQLFPAV